MKKILILIMVLILSISLVACSSDKEINTDNQDNHENMSNDNNNNDENNNHPQSNEIVFGEKLQDDGVIMFDSEMQLFTKDTLPESSKREDFDGDGLKNQEEIDANTDMYKVDTDNDGLSDYDEIKTTKTDPNKWSTRDDNVSDLTFWISNNPEFKEGYTSTNEHDLKVYLIKPEDQLYVFSKVSTNVFDNLETMSEALQIKYFSGKVALNCNKYIDEVAKSIAVYKDINGKPTKVSTNVTKDRLVEFELNENDIFVIVYEAPTVELSNPEPEEEKHNN